MRYFSTLSDTLSLAHEIGRTMPFDATAAFVLMSRVVADVDLPLGRTMKRSTEQALFDSGEQEPYRSAVARYALCHLVAEIERVLALEKTLSDARRDVS